MSAILGPIHHWLFRKIQFQDALTGEILRKAKEKGYDGEKLSRVDEMGILPQGELGNIIDSSNIHGWLQGKIALVEYRLAAGVKSMLEERKEAMEDICAIAFAFGREHGAGSLSLGEGFRFYEDTLVNGMPCDGVNMVLNEDGEELIWEETVDIHAPYWQELGMEGALFYEIRDALVKGLFEGSGLKYQALGNGTYKLVKE